MQFNGGCYGIGLHGITVCSCTNKFSESHIRTQLESQFLAPLLVEMQLESYAGYIFVICTLPLQSGSQKNIKGFCYFEGANSIDSNAHRQLKITIVEKLLSWSIDMIQ